MIVRYEPWGAWVKLDDVLVGLTQDGVRALGLASSALWNESNTTSETEEPPLLLSAPLEVHVAVTSRCAAGCEGCYLDARPDGIEPPREVIEERFDAIARAGVFTVAFGGGEPTLRDDIGDLADSARARGLTPVVTTSGLGLGSRKIDHLTHFSQVNVSYDGAAEAYQSVRGFDGSESAENAIAKLAERGVKVGVNVVLTRDTFDCVFETLKRAFDLGAREAQLLRYKPAGRASTTSTTSLDYLSRRLSHEQTRRLGSVLRDLARALPDMRIRIDCALVPFLSADPEIARRPEDLARWGVLGCEAGNALAATRVDGKVLPCSFASASALDVSDLPSPSLRRDDPLLSAFRAFPDAPTEPCASCTLRSVCRGGCKIVSSYIDGVIGPDPECPRVVEHRRGLPPNAS